MLHYCFGLVEIIVIPILFFFNLFWVYMAPMHMISAIESLLKIELFVWVRESG